MIPADLILATAARAAKTLPDPKPLLRACHEAAEAVRAAFDSPEDPGAELALDLQTLLGRLAMLEAWAPSSPMPSPCAKACFEDFARPEVAIHAAVNLKHSAEAVIAGRRGQHSAMPVYRHFAGATCFRVLDGLADHVRVRRAAADPRVEPDWIDVREAMYRGRCGGHVVTMRYFVPADLDPAGDLGGEGDRMIAEAARWVTKETEPEKVVQALADNGQRRHQEDLAQRVVQFAVEDIIRRHRLQTMTGDDLREMTAALAAAQEPLPMPASSTIRIEGPLDMRPTLTIAKHSCPTLTLDVLCALIPIPFVSVDARGDVFHITFPEGTPMERINAISGLLPWGAEGRITATREVLR